MKPCVSCKVMHIITNVMRHSSYLTKDGVKVFRYICRSCNANKMANYRSK